jgi:hypothetical protein
VLAMLVAMAGLAGVGAFTSPMWGGRREASGGGDILTITPTRRPDDRRPPHKGEVEPAFTLPRHLRLAVLRLLRPAEAAARRLIIVAARGMVVEVRNPTGPAIPHNGVISRAPQAIPVPPPPNPSPQGGGSRRRFPSPGKQCVERKRCQVPLPLVGRG